MKIYKEAQALTDILDDLLYEKRGLIDLNADAASRLYASRINEIFPPYTIDLGGQNIRFEASEILELRQSIYSSYIEKCKEKDICKLDEKIYPISSQLFGLLADYELTFISSYIYLRQAKELPPRYRYSDNTDSFFEIWYIPEPYYKDSIGMNVYQWYVQYIRQPGDYGVCLTFQHNALLSAREVKIKVLSTLAKANHKLLTKS